MICKDPTRPAKERVEDLLSGMTQEDKIINMTRAYLLDVITDYY